MTTTATRLDLRWMIRRDLPGSLAVTGPGGAPGEADLLEALRRADTIGIVACRGDAIEGYVVYRLERARLVVLWLAGAPDARAALLARAVRKAFGHRREWLAVPLALLAPACGLDLTADLLRAGEGGSDDPRTFGPAEGLARILVTGLPAAAPGWLTDTVRALLKVYDVAPILADALQDAGCDAEGLLAALRAGGSVTGRIVRALRFEWIGE